LGNKFRTEMKGTEEGAKYQKLCRADAASFRLEWAKSKLKDMIERKVHVQGWQRVDKTKGRYRNLGRLVQDLGGFSCGEAIRGACTAARKCTMMGSPWIRRHPQTNLLEYLVLELEFEECFSQSWQHYKETVTNTAGDSTGHQRAISGEAGGLTDKKGIEAKGKGAEPKQHAIAEGSGQAGGDPGVVPPAPKPPPTPKDPAKQKFAALTKDALKQKTLFHAATSGYVQLVQSIESDASWEWARGSRLTALKAASEVLKSELNEWHREFLVSGDLSAMRKLYTSDRIAVELASFVKCAPKIEALQCITKAMYRAHAELTK
jgi:hypothetical protein